MESCDIFIVGAGAAGLSAARAAAGAGCKSILVADYNSDPGGILRQCAHRGFGGEMTGTEYIRKLMQGFPKEIAFMWNTAVLSVDERRTAVLSSAEYGLKRIHFKQMILAAGCREITAGSLGIAGTRPENVCTAGQAQADLNLRGRIPEGPVVILGSGDLGLIMARHLADAGVEIAAIVEKKDSCGGMARNRSCIAQYRLPLICNATVSCIFGQERLSGVNVLHADTGVEEFIPCKTLLIAAGLLPERELVRHLPPNDWLHICGNCSSIHPMVEGVVQEGIRAGRTACEKLRGSK